MNSVDRGIAVGFESVGRMSGCWKCRLTIDDDDFLMIERGWNAATAAAVAGCDGDGSARNGRVCGVNEAGIVVEAVGD